MIYKVRMEFDISSVDLMEVDVEAGSEAEAVKIAIDNYQHDVYDDADMYESVYRSISLNENTKDWIVEKENK